MLLLLLCYVVDCSLLVKTSKEQSLQLGERLRSLCREIKIYWVIYPSIFSLFRQRGRYVCIKRNHCLHLAEVIVPSFRCNAFSRSWVRWCPSAIPCRLASTLLFICCCTSERLISALMASYSIQQLSVVWIHWYFVLQCWGTDYMVAVSWALYFARAQRGCGGQVHHHI